MSKIQVYFIQSLPEVYLAKAISSFKSTIETDMIDEELSIVLEEETREETLNTILSMRDNERDLMIIADDVIFTPGWDTALKTHYGKGDIIGFSMVDADSGLLQDFGYDFILVDGQLSYRGLYKHNKISSTELPAFRQCSSITGCAMFIKSFVFDSVKKFPLEGANRWGELLFCHLAMRAGFSTIVLSAHLIHSGISTKQNTKIKYNSLSWQIEKDLWSVAVEKYLYDVIPSEIVSNVIDSNLIEKINSSKNCLIYGAGTVANTILESIANTENIEICSGLAEEVGLTILGKKILDVRNVNAPIYSCIIISAIGYENQIIEKYFQSRDINLILLNQENFVISMRQ